MMSNKSKPDESSQVDTDIVTPKETIPDESSQDDVNIVTSKETIHGESSQVKLIL